MTNSENLRQMPDEKLIDAIGLSCRHCIYHNHGKCAGQDKECTEGNLAWLKQEVNKDA